MGKNTFKKLRRIMGSGYCVEQKACLQLTCAFLLFQWISKLSQEPQSSQLGTMNITPPNVQTLQARILCFTANLSFTMYRFCSLSAYGVNLTKLIRISNPWYWWKSAHKQLKLFKGRQTCAWSEGSAEVHISSKQFAGPTSSALEAEGSTLVY